MTTTALTQHTHAVIERFDQLSATGDWSRFYAVADGRTYHLHIRRLRVLELLPPRLGRVVDLGCGPGVMVDRKEWPRWRVGCGDGRDPQG